MRALLNYLRRSPAERRLARRALWWVTRIHVSLLVRKFDRTRSWLASKRAPAAAQASPTEEEIARIAWAVSAASSFVPGARCLSQALASQVLLGRAGLAASLRLGIGRDDEGVVEAHAWLEHEGRVVYGEPRPDEFKPLEDFESAGL
ncbi:MAG: lasso peptide biosynthesis B2 protein [bacterium]|nr:lasso peptide biosynthesis B2 protein [bacterium]